MAAHPGAPATTFTTSSLRGMGSGIDLVVVVPAGATRLSDHLHELAHDRLAELERHWSRFDPGSDITALNRARGRAVDVHADTARLLRHAAQCWRGTDGRFDPTVHDVLVADGYDVSLERVRARGADDPTAAGPATTTIERPRPARGLGSLRVTGRDGRFRARILPDVHVDPGAIGKGLAADLVVEELLGAGALGASASVGGDVVAGGTPPTPSGWWVEVVDPAGTTARPTLVGVGAGAVVTSTPMLRRWRAPDGTVANHLRDPAHGGSLADPDLRFVTVIGGVGWWSEAQATAACVEAVRHPGGALAWARGVVAHDRERALVVGVGATAVVHSPAAEPHLWDTGAGVA